jgi:hypothetical protein
MRIATDLNVRLDSAEDKALALAIRALNDASMPPPAPPVPMLLWCPGCGERHIDEGDFATKPHHTHACQGCGMVWRPAIGPTCGVQFLPGFKDGASSAR